MADADNKETSDTKASGEGLDQIASIKSELDTKLADIADQLKAMNQIQQEVVARAAAQTPRKVEEEDLDPFDAKNFKSRIVEEAATMTRELMREEQRKNSTIYQLAQEYPEIQTDSTLQKAIMNEQRTLPKSMQDSAEGYEMAVLKAVAKQGVLPKSKRPKEDVDADVSVGGSRGVAREARSKSNKVSEKTLLIAKLLGRDINDKEVLKGLEEATNRDTYNRYR